MMKSMDITIRNATCVRLPFLLPVGDHHDILHIAPCQFKCISEMFTSQFQYPYSKIFLFHPKMMNTITKNGVHRTTVRSDSEPPNNCPKGRSPRKKTVKKGDIVRTGRGVPDLGKISTLSRFFLLTSLSFGGFSRQSMQ